MELGTGNWELETGHWQLATDNMNRLAGSWFLEAGSCEHE